MADTLRYARSEDLLRLALKMSGSRRGLSLADIQDEFEVGRRTAERMRDAILRIFPDTIESLDDSRVKHWHIPRQRVNDLISVQAEDLSALKSAIDLAQANNMGDVAERLSILSEKLNSRIDCKDLRKIEPDLEALIEAEGLAVRQGPRQTIDKLCLEDLRFAITAPREIKITYKSRASGKRSQPSVQPYGFLYGNRNYLVAKDVQQDGYKLYCLANIEAVTVEEHSFERDKDFDLHEYAKRSFGVFQEDPMDVRLMFSKDAADDVREYMFHPNQKIHEQKDGRILVEFTAGGKLEMCWEIFKWGDSVTIVEPAELQEHYTQLIRQIRN